MAIINEIFQWNNNKIFQLNEEDKFLFTVSIESSKCEKPEKLKSFIENFSDDFTYFCKFKNDKSIILCTNPSDLSYFKSSEELKYALNGMESIGLRAHNAVNNYLKICFKLCYDNKINKKADLFFQSNESLCRKVARKDKAFHFSFENFYHNQLATNNNHSFVEYRNGLITYKFFRSTLKFKTIVATVEFIKSIYDFCSKNNVTFDLLYENNDIAKEKYIDFVCNHSEYLELKNYLKQREIIR